MILAASGEAFDNLSKCPVGVIHGSTILLFGSGRREIADKLKQSKMVKPFEHRANRFDPASPPMPTDHLEPFCGGWGALFGDLTAATAIPGPLASPLERDHRPNGSHESPKSAGSNPRCTTGARSAIRLKIVEAADCSSFVRVTARLHRPPRLGVYRLCLARLAARLLTSPIRRLLPWRQTALVGSLRRHRRCGIYSISQW